jgi:hypothetical protein
MTLLVLFMNEGSLERTRTGVRLSQRTQGHMTSSMLIKYSVLIRIGK